VGEIRFDLPQALVRLLRALAFGDLEGRPDDLAIVVTRPRDTNLATTWGASISLSKIEKPRRKRNFISAGVSPQLSQPGGGKRCCSKSKQ